MKDGMSTAKTNKMKSSITPWNQVSLRSPKWEKQAWPQKQQFTSSLAELWLTRHSRIPSLHHQRALLHVHVSHPSTVQKQTNLITKQRSKSKNTLVWTWHVRLVKPSGDMWHPMLCSLEHHKHFTALQQHCRPLKIQYGARIPLSCVGQLGVWTWQGCKRKSQRGHQNH